MINFDGVRGLYNSVYVSDEIMNLTRLIVPTSQRLLNFTVGREESSPSLCEAGEVREVLVSLLAIVFAA
jgi:hypothetical protein